jgi:hypothetical protein
VTASEAVEASEEPTAFVARTVNVYAVPLVSPETVQVVALVVEQVKEPGDEVTVYPVIAEPPVSVGAVHETTTEALPRVPLTAVGEPGTVAGVTEAEAVEELEVPTSFVAVTVKV